MTGRLSSDRTRRSRRTDAVSQRSVHYTAADGDACRKRRCRRHSASALGTISDVRAFSLKRADGLPKTLLVVYPGASAVAEASVVFRRREDPPLPRCAQ